MFIVINKRRNQLLNFRKLRCFKRNQWNTWSMNWKLKKNLALTGPLLCVSLSNCRTKLICYCFQRSRSLPSHNSPKNRTKQTAQPQTNGEREREQISVRFCSTYVANSAAEVYSVSSGDLLTPIEYSKRRSDWRKYVAFEKCSMYVCCTRCVYNRLVDSGYK